MINDFHFSEDFLSCDSLGIPLITDSLIEDWLTYGCLVFPVAQDDKYLQWLELHNVEISKKWKTAFSSNLSNDLSGTYRVVSSISNTTSCFDYIDSINASTLLINETELNSINIASGSNTRGQKEIVNVNNFKDSVFLKSQKT